jgi:hypothetical protein
MPVKNCCRFLLFASLCLVAPWSRPAENESLLPQFGRDTVLVWKITTQATAGSFVVRLAGFYPDLLMEWEDFRSQGTVFIPNEDILKADGYTNKRLFKPGMDTRSENSTTMWLSRKIFQALKEKKKVKCDIDRVSGRMTYEGDEEISVEVNGSTVVLPAIRVQDDRGAERWFLDREQNPLMMKYTLRQYSQTLVSITTNRKNTLRWLKGAKLRRLLPN